MIITVKTLQQKSFKIEIEDTANVKALKQKIEDDQGEDFPSDAQKLIYAGKILDNNAPLSKYNIQECNFVVVMVTKARAPPKPAAEEETSTSGETAPSGETTTTGETSATPQETSTESTQPQAQTVTTTTTTTAAEESTTRTETTQATPTVPSGETTDTAGSDEALQQAGSVLVTGSQFEEAIVNLMALGFERDHVVRALNASFNNPDRAADLLMSGAVPESEPQPIQEEDVPVEQPTRDVPSGGQVAAGQITAGQVAAGQIATGQVAGTGQQEGQAASTEGNPLEFLASRPQFQLLRRMIQEDPNLLPSLMQQIAQTNPQLIQLISQNRQGFIDLLNQPPDSSSSSSASTPTGPVPPGAGSPGGPLPQGIFPPGMAGMQMPPGGGPPVASIQVTPEEKEAIDRLKNLGFSESLVVQAYFACDKNEELAANFLLQQGPEDD